MMMSHLIVLLSGRFEVALLIILLNKYNIVKLINVNYTLYSILRLLICCCLLLIAYLLSLSSVPT